MRFQRGKKAALLVGVPCLVTLAVAAWPLGRLISERMYLARNVERFCKVVSPAYSGWSNELTAEYRFGVELRPDILTPRPMPPQSIVWIAPGPRGQGCSFNRAGLLLLPFPFEDRVEVDSTIEVGEIDTFGSISVLLGASPDGKRYVAANFATIEVWENGERKHMLLPPRAEHQKSPSLWFPKTVPGGVGMRVRYEPVPVEKKARVTIWFDIEGRNELVNFALVPAWPGLVGLSWNRVKFNLVRLRIRGRLDGPEAVKALETIPPKAPKRPAVTGSSI